MPGVTSDEDGKLGYCWMHHFKCHSARTCDTWAKGGPITTDKVSEGWQERAFAKSEKRSEESYLKNLPEIPWNLEYVPNARLSKDSWSLGSPAKSSDQDIHCSHTTVYRFRLFLFLTKIEFHSHLLHSPSSCQHPLVNRRR